MNRDSLQRFDQRAADQRTALWGIEYRIDGSRSTFEGEPNNTITRRQLEVGGWNPDVSALLRVNRAELCRPGAARITFALGQVLVRGNTATYRIAEIRDNPGAPEIVLGLAADLSRA